MKKLHFLILITFLGVATMSCGEDSGGDENPTGLNGNWRLNGITVNLDGTLLTTIRTLGFKASFDNDSFTYTDDGEKSGTWSINSEETELTVSYGTVSNTYPIISKTDTKLLFTFNTIDLTASSFSEEERNIFRLINQNLTQSGSSWRSQSNGAQSVSLVFTLIK